MWPCVVWDVVGQVIPLPEAKAAQVRDAFEVRRGTKHHTQHAVMA